MEVCQAKHIVVKMKSCEEICYLVYYQEVRYNLQLRASQKDRHKSQQSLQHQIGRILPAATDPASQLVTLSSYSQPMRMTNTNKFVFRVKIDGRPKSMGRARDWCVIHIHKRVNLVPHCTHASHTQAEKLQKKI